MMTSASCYVIYELDYAYCLIYMLQGFIFHQVLCSFYKIILLDMSTANLFNYEFFILLI